MCIYIYTYTYIMQLLSHSDVLFSQHSTWDGAAQTWSLPQHLQPVYIYVCECVCECVCVCVCVM